MDLHAQCVNNTLIQKKTLKHSGCKFSIHQGGAVLLYGGEK